MQASGARHTPQRPPPGSLSRHQTPDARREAAGVVPGLVGTRDWGETSRSVNAGGVTSGPPSLAPSQQHRGAADRPARAETPPGHRGARQPARRPGQAPARNPDNRSRAPWAFPSCSARRLQHTLPHRPLRPAPEEPPQPMCDRTRVRTLTRVETHAHAVCTHATRTHTPRVRGRPEGPDSPGGNAAHPAECGFRVNSRSCWNTFYAMYCLSEAASLCLPRYAQGFHAAHSSLGACGLPPGGG